MTVVVEVVVVVVAVVFVLVEVSLCVVDDDDDVWVVFVGDDDVAICVVDNAVDEDDIVFRLGLVLLLLSKLLLFGESEIRIKIVLLFGYVVLIIN